MRPLFAAAALASALALPAGAVDWYVGSGKHGAKTVTGLTTENTVHTNINTAVPAGGMVVGVGAVAGFVPGDLVLLMQNFGPGAGNYEFARLSAVGGGTLFLTTGTKSGYSAGGAQILVVKEYSSVSVSGGLAVIQRASGGVRRRQRNHADGGNIDERAGFRRRRGTAGRVEGVSRRRDGECGGDRTTI